MPTVPAGRPARAAAGRPPRAAGKPPALHTHARAPACTTRTHARACTCTRTHALKHARTCTHMHARARTCTHTRASTGYGHGYDERGYCTSSSGGLVRPYDNILTIKKNEFPFFFYGLVSCHIFYCQNTGHHIYRYMASTRPSAAALYYCGTVVQRYS